MGKKGRRKARDPKYAIGVDLSMGPDASVYYTVVRAHREGNARVIDEVKVHSIVVGPAVRQEP